MNIKLGLAGAGAVGTPVAEALINNEIPGYELHAYAELGPAPDLGDVPQMSLEDLAKNCDRIIECMPAHVLPELAGYVFNNNKSLIVISSAGLVAYPQILEQKRSIESLIYVPEGALTGVMEVHELARTGIASAKIISTKKPEYYAGAPYVRERQIPLEDIKELTQIFSGNAAQSSIGFPANTNVAATLALHAGLKPENVMVEVWADPSLAVNTHEVIAVGKNGKIVHFKVLSTPSKRNPKTSESTPQSIINVLKGAPCLIL